MATSKSPNLNLTIEDNNEFIGIETTAENFSIIDEAFGGLDEKIKSAGAKVAATVSQNGSTTSADKTFAELKAEAEKGNDVIVVFTSGTKVENARLPLVEKKDTSLIFSGYAGNSLWKVIATNSGWSASAVAPAASGHGHDNASKTSPGFMAASDKVKLDGIEAGANKTTVDSKISETSTNPAQTKVICAWVKTQISNAFLVDEGGIAS